MSHRYRFRNQRYLSSTAVMLETWSRRFIFATAALNYHSRLWTEIKMVFLSTRSQQLLEDRLVVIELVEHKFHRSCLTIDW